MRKLLFNVLLLFAVAVNAMAADVSVTMNAVSRTMTLTPKGGGNPVEAGDPASYKYTFTADPGDYILSAYATDGSTLNGTIELTITEEAEQAFSFITVTAWVTNSDWALNTDYTFSSRVLSKEGVLRASEPGSSITANRVTFLAYTGDTFYSKFDPNQVHTEEGYLPFEASATLTANINSSGTIPMGYPYSITVPENATLFVGRKYAHFVPFTEIEPKEAPLTQGGKTTYNYHLANGQVYNYRVSETNKLTHAGYFSMNQSLAPLEITADMLNSADPKRIDHNVKSNSGLNVGDIFLNINEKGHLKLEQNETHQLLTMRTWQLTDNSTNNYFIEPDFHYTIINEDGTLNNSVITIDDKGLLTAIGSGTVIVLVTYDAIALNESYTMGRDWGAIWPENTGSFVVAVGSSESGITSNIKINQALNETTKKVAGDAVDAEHDVFYYLEEEGGFDYTFTPEGVSGVSIAYPVIGTEMATYNGFGTDGVIYDSETGSYTVRLIHGRNIVKLTSESGQSEYQIFTAKPTGYVVNNLTNPGEQIQPGDQIGIQFSGLFHPANKLAGVYNMSAYVQFNGIPNGTSLILSGNQYQFGSTESAQLVKVDIPSDWNPDEDMNFTEGVIQVNGFGDPIGNHRIISPEYGRSPNFTAIAHKTYFGALPGVSIDIHEKDLYAFSFTGLPDGASFVLKNNKDEVLTADENGLYTETYGTYAYEAACAGYRALRGTVSISSSSPETQEITLTMILVDNAVGWDGATTIEPAQVSSEESDTQGGIFEGLEGYYKIASGYHLAWFAGQVDTGNSSISAVLINDIDLADYQWTPIGNSTAANQYKGTFDGANYVVTGLYINTTATYQALFGYINGAVVRNISVSGEVTSTANYAAGIIAYSAGASIIQNCHNKANVIGKQYTAGVVSYITSTSTATTINECSNSGDLSSTSSYIGGVAGSVVGSANYSVTNSFNNGTINSSSNYAGGVIGGLSQTKTVGNCYNDGDVSGLNYVGGIAGSSGLCTMSNNYNTGTITASNYAGGIVGNGGSSSISNSYNTGIISGTISGASVGAIKGVNGTIDNAYTLGDYTDGAVTKTTDQFASGEVAWLLGDAFGQEIAVDLLPKLDGEKVYQIEYANNLSVEKETVYSNAVLPLIEKEGYQAEWYDVPYGNIVTEISTDGTLYLLFTKIDNTPPSKPNDLTGIPTETNIELAWNASVDDEEVVGYTIYVNDEFEAIVQNTNYTLKRLNPNTEYTIAVEAFDASGNRSEKASITVKTLKTTGLDQIKTIDVYPNPFVDYINIRASENGIAEIYTLQGRKVYFEDIAAGANKLNVSLLSSGVYLLRFENQVFKLIKK